MSFILKNNRDKKEEEKGQKKKVVLYKWGPSGDAYLARHLIAKGKIFTQK